MLMKLIDKLKGKKEKSFDITISENNDILKIVISDYISIVEYLDGMPNLADFLSNNILWNSKRQCVNKGTYYIIFNNAQIYNILVNDEWIKIDERIKINNMTEEKIIAFNKNNNDYEYCSFKHDQTGTSFVRYYSKKGINIKELELSKDEAFEEISCIFSNLENIKNVDDILKIDLLKSNILEDFNNCDKPKCLNKSNN